MVSIDRRAVIAGALASAGALVTGCNSSAGRDRAPAAASSPTAGSTFPVSITSALGTATITAAPARVVTLGWGSDDACLALGSDPIGTAINLSSSADGLTPWARAAYGSVRPQTFTADSDNVPYEKIASLRPDVILGVYSGITPEQYAKLSAIAPTVGYPDQPWATSWTDQLDLVGRALGRASEAAVVADRIRGSIAAAAAAHPQFRGKSAIFGSVTQPGSFNLYLAADPRMRFLGELGFVVSDAATTTFEREAGSPSFATTVSLEQLPKLDVDLLVAWYFDEASAARTRSQPVMARLRAVRNRAYVPITDPALVFATSAPNALSIPWMLDRYVPLLATAAGNVS